MSGEAAWVRSPGQPASNQIVGSPLLQHSLAESQAEIHELSAESSTQQMRSFPKMTSTGISDPPMANFSTRNASTASQGGYRTRRRCIYALMMRPDSAFLKRIGLRTYSASVPSHSLEEGQPCGGLRRQPTSKAHSPYATSIFHFILV
jgi:hypothetical protein